MKNLNLYAAVVTLATLAGAAHASLPEDRDFTGTFACTLGARDLSGKWQVKAADLVVKRGQGSLRITIGNMVAEADYGMDGEGPLVSAQLTDTKSGFRSATDLEVKVAEFSVDLYDDKAQDGGGTGQFYCRENAPAAVK